MASDESSATGTTLKSRELFWNREYGTKTCELDLTLPITKQAKIICLSDPLDNNNVPLYDVQQLPDGCQVIHVGTKELDVRALKHIGCNAVFVSDGLKAREPLKQLITELGDQLEWIHSRSAGIDAFYSDVLSSQFHGVMTNAKGQYSSTLAEYTLAACLYFAKDFPKLLKQKSNKQWLQYPILELRGSTLGVIGFGDIGQAAARLAASFGMKIIGLTRKPQNRDDLLHGFPSNAVVQIMDSTTTPGALLSIFAQSDYILVATPLTKDTNKMIGKEAFDVAKVGSILINVGRGPVIDENSLINALQSRERLKGAALDVATIEPLPTTSPLWTLDNVLLSPHNMDMTETFMLESTEFYRNEQLPRFVRGLPLLNPVDVKVGY